MGVLAVPPVGGVTACGMVTLIPVGALPTQETEKDTGELKPPIEFTSTLVEVLKPWITATVPEDGEIEKSDAATGARTIGVPPIATVS